MSYRRGFEEGVEGERLNWQKGLSFVMITYMGFFLFFFWGLFVMGVLQAWSEHSTESGGEKDIKLEKGKTIGRLCLCPPGIFEYAIWVFFKSVVFSVLLI